MKIEITIVELEDAAQAVNQLAALAGIQEDAGTVNIIAQPVRELFAKLNRELIANR